MRRVASLFLPHWSIDRIARAERRTPPPPDAAAPGRGDPAARAGVDARTAIGWRPGARWARADHELATRAQIAALPAHQRPSPRELGRRSETASVPFRLLPGDDGGKATEWIEPHDASGSASNAGVQTLPSPRTCSGVHRAAPSTGFGNATRWMPEQVRHDGGHLQAPPLVTVHKIGSRVEIAAAAPAAMALGIVPGMALTQARAAVPGLDVRDADPAGDAADLARIAVLLARRWCPIVAHDGADGLLLDVTGTTHLHGGEAAMIRRLLRLLARAGVTARIAIADTAGAAWAVARFGDRAAIVAPGEQVAALAALPVAALRLEAAAADRLATLGIETIGDLLAMPRAPLVRRFGAAIARRLDQATGAAAEPIDPIVVPVPIAVERRFAEPIATAEAIHHWLGGLVAELCGALRQAGRGARALLFVAARIDNSAQVIRIGLARPTRDPAHLLRLIARRIEEIDPGYGVEALTLHVRRADPLDAELLGPALAEAQAPDLAPLIDTLANRIGMNRLWRRCAVESDVPERSVGDGPPLDPPEPTMLRLKPDDVRLLDTRAPDHPWHPRWPRPARLLLRPERIDHVIAELPDQPPRRFTWRGQRHVVVRADGPERIMGEWWRRAGERHAVRDYFQVEDEAGARFWLFRRGDGVRPETGDLSWYLHGAFG